MALHDFISGGKYHGDSSTDHQTFLLLYLYIYMTGSEKRAHLVHTNWIGN